MEDDLEPLPKNETDNQKESHKELVHQYTNEML